MINIKGLNKAEVLKALYDHSHVPGYGFLQAVPNDFVTVKHCEELLQRGTRFDYLYGKVLKVDLSDDEFDERLYDRDNGLGAARRAINSLRKDLVNWSVKIDMLDVDVRICEDMMTRSIDIRGKDRASLDKLIWHLMKVRENIDDYCDIFVEEKNNEHV